MDLDSTMKLVRSLYQTVSGKTDQEVSLIYKGSGYGVTKPYLARVDAREASNETYEGALNILLDSLQKELADKVKSAESEAVRLRQILNQLKKN